MRQILATAAGTSRRTANRQLSWCVLLVLPLATTGCQLGPKVLERTHRPYNDTMKNVLEEQMLLNIVRLRYNESAYQLDISSVTAQADRNLVMGAQPFFAATSNSGIFRFFPFILPSISSTTTDRPTIVYRPLDDPENIQRLLLPGSVNSLITLAETSWPASTIFPLWVDYLNQLPNAIGANGPPGGVVSDSSHFRRVVELLQSLHDAQAAHFVTKDVFLPMGSPLPPAAMTARAQAEAIKSGVTYQKQADGSWQPVKRSTGLALKINPAAGADPRVLELCQLLHLKPGLTSYDVTVISSKAFEIGEPPGEPLTTLNILPRSTMGALYYLSSGVQVPEEHLTNGIVAPLGTPELPTAGVFTVSTVCAGKHDRPPKSAYVAVKYQGYWYYIDEHDIESRRTFSLMLLMGRASLAKATKEGPVLTLPVGP